MMIQGFYDKGTEDIFNGVDSVKARKTCPKGIWDVARRKLDLMNAAQGLQDLKSPPNNRLKPLDGNRKGQHSIRINDQFRICFIWTTNGPGRIEITDYH